MEMPFNAKQRLFTRPKKSRTIFGLKMWIWHKLGLRHRIYDDQRYFANLFESNPNVSNLSFEHGLSVCQFRNTTYLLVTRPKNLIESDAFLYGAWEPHILSLISNFLNSTKGSVIDVGANIGASSLPLAKIHQDSQFYLFEPHPVVFQDLINNISINKIKNIKANNIAVTNSTQKTVPFFAQKNATNFGLSSLNLNHDIHEYDRIDVQCMTLDLFFSENPLPVSVIKIDTQGHELNVILSARQIIKRDRPAIIFEFESEYFKTPSDEDAARKEITKFFDEVNYELFLISRKPNYMPRVNLKNYFHGEILAVPLTATTTSPDN